MMYELNLTQEKFDEFIKEVRYLMIRRNISTKKLSEMTGYTTSTLYGFMSGRNSRFVAASISKALEMEKKYEVQKSNADSIS